MKINHIECEIICDDVTLVEYQEKSDPAEGDKKTKSCYIVSEAGKVRVAHTMNIVNRLLTQHFVGYKAP